MGEDEIKDIKEKEIILEEIGSTENIEMEDNHGEIINNISSTLIKETNKEKEAKEVFDEKLLKEIEEIIPIMKDKINEELNEDNIEEKEIENIEETPLKEMENISNIEELEWKENSLEELQEKEIEFFQEDKLIEIKGSENKVEQKEDFIEEKKTEILEEIIDKFQESSRLKPKNIFLRITKSITRFLFKVTVITLCISIIFNIAFVYASKYLIMDDINKSIKALNSAGNDTQRVRRILDIDTQIREQMKNSKIRENQIKATKALE